MAGGKSAAEQVVQAIRDKFGGDAALVLGQGSSLSEVRHAVPTGLTVLDRWVLGIGGLPVGRLTEMFGQEGVGKSSLAASIIAGCQRDGGLAIVADTENALEGERAAAFGVDLDSVVLIQPAHLEDLLAQSEVALRRAAKAVKGKPILFTWDSIAATPTKREVEEGLAGEQAIGQRARSLSLACRVFARLAAELNVCMLWVNQVRQKIGALYGDPEVTPGGLAVKFHATCRLRVSRGASIKDGDEHAGMYVTVTATKNKLVPPYRKCRAKLDYAKGWVDAWSVLDHAKDRGLVSQSAKGKKALAEALEKLGWADAKVEAEEAVGSVSAAEAFEKVLEEQ